MTAVAFCRQLSCWISCKNLSYASHSETDGQAINKMPTGVEIDETVPVGKFAVAFTLVDEWLFCK